MRGNGGIWSKYIRCAYVHGIVKEQVELEKNEIEIKALQSEMEYPAKVS